MTLASHKKERNKLKRKMKTGETNLLTRDVPKEWEEKRKGGGSVDIGRYPIDYLIIQDIPLPLHNGVFLRHRAVVLLPPDFNRHFFPSPVHPVDAHQDYHHREMDVGQSNRREIDEVAVCRSPVGC